MIVDVCGGFGGLPPWHTAYWNSLYWARSAGLQALAILPSMSRVLSSAQMQAKSDGLHFELAMHSKMMV